MKIVNSLFKFLIDLYRRRQLVYQLTKRDFSARYLGSYLGLVWAVLNPLITIFIFWFVFEMGFKIKTVDEGYPFLLWFVSGLIPWFFFSESLLTATNTVLEHAYLVKKVVFRVSVLPIVKIISALLIHCIFIIILVVMTICYGHYPTLATLQVFYYLLCTVVLLLGLSWLTSSVVVFLRDVNQAVGVVVQLGFWVTPIFWSYKNLPPQYQTLVRLNPVMYITEGYRNAFLYHRWFWHDWQQTIYFWVITGVIFLSGAIVFRKLRPHFADVL